MKYAIGIVGLTALFIVVALASSATAQSSACANTVSMPADASTQLLADCDALIASKSALKGTGSLNWWTGKDISQWNGITVNGGRVTGLDLRDRSLDGTIPERLTDLDALTSIHLSGNSFTGCIPAGLASITNNDLADTGLAFCGGGQSQTPTLATPTPTPSTGTPQPTPTPTSGTPEPTPTPGSVDLSAIESRLAAVENRLTGIDGKITTIEADIELLRATVTPVPVPDGKPIEISGSGSATKRIELTEGLWSVSLTVEDNQTCNRSCSPDFFDVDIDSVARSESESLAFEYKKEWTGVAALHVGDEFSDDLAPGRQVVTVEATGTWEITFLKEG